MLQSKKIMSLRPALSPRRQPRAVPQRRSRAQPARSQPSRGARSRSLSGLRRAATITVAAGLVLLVVWFGTSAVKQILLRPYHVLAHVVRDPPLELMGTWQSYQHLFYRFETRHLSAVFLAVFGHELSKGRQWNEVKWQIRMSLKPWDMIRPEIDKFGFMQFSPEHFAEASAYCLEDHQPVIRKRWYEFGGCFNAIKTRGSVSHSLELAAASMQWFINHHVLAYDIPHTLRELRSLAIIRHLCGTVYGERFIQNQFKLEGIHSCQEHKMREFIETVHDREFVLKQKLRHHQNFGVEVSAISSSPARSSSP